MILLQALVSHVPASIPPRLRYVEQDEVFAFFLPAWMPPAQADLQQEAVRFFERNQQLFAQTDVIEFRFPTYVADEVGLRGLLREHAGRVREELTRLRGLAQLTVYLAEGQAAADDRSSGTAYLRSKRAQLASKDASLQRIQQVLGAGIRESLVQEERISLLVPKAEAAAMMRALRAEQHDLAGPFPPSAFAKLVF